MSGEDWRKKLINWDSERTILKLTLALGALEVDADVRLTYSDGESLVFSSIDSGAVFIFRSGRRLNFFSDFGSESEKLVIEVTSASEPTARVTLVPGSR